MWLREDSSWIFCIWFLISIFGCVLGSIIDSMLYSLRSARSSWLSMNCSYCSSNWVYSCCCYSSSYPSSYCSCPSSCPIPIIAHPSHYSIPIAHFHPSFWNLVSISVGFSSHYYCSPYYFQFFFLHAIYFWLILFPQDRRSELSLYCQCSIIVSVIEAANWIHCCSWILFLFNFYYEFLLYLFIILLLSYYYFIGFYSSINY